MKRWWMVCGTALAAIAVLAVAVVRSETTTKQRTGDVPPLTAASSVGAVIDRMANAIDCYDTVEATFVERHLLDTGMETTETQIWMRLRPNPGAKSVVLLPDGQQLSSLFDGVQLLEQNLTQETYRLVAVSKDAPPQPLWQLLLHPQQLLTRWKKDAGTPYRQAPAIVRAPAASALFPQQEALALMGRSSVAIDGAEQMLGRTVLQVTIVPSEYHQGAWDRVAFWVDAETGILMKQEYWKNGRIVDERAATALKVNPNLNTMDFRIEMPKDARRLPPPGG